MCKVILVISSLAFLFVVSAASAASSTVRGHWRDTNHDGIKDTFIDSYQRTAPDSSRTNNYDYPGNYNPNTGRMTPLSDSLRETYPTNPNPYDRRPGPGLGW